MDSEASRTNDPLVLAGGLARFLKCAHSAWGREDAKGRYSGGYDYCSLVSTAMYSAPLGPRYICTHFHAERSFSTRGHPVYRHAANLLVKLENPEWRYGDKARTAGAKFVESKSATIVDAAFVATLLATLEGNRERADAALIRFADGYLKSDWGRHKPFTKGVFVRAIASYCGSKLGGEPLAATGRMPGSPDGDAIWDRLRELREGALLTEYRFPSPLEFLDSTVSV